MEEVWQSNPALNEPTPATCPICDAADPVLRYQITRFRVHRCRACGQIYLWPLLTEDEVREMFSRLYTEGAGSVPELKSYYGFTYDDAPSNPLVQLYEHWLDELERHVPTGRLLDIGCGTGLFLAVARRRGWEPFGIDDCAEATTHAREHFGLEVLDGGFSDATRSGDQFDVITMWDIIEHARRPVELLESARACLAPAGVMGISTPNQRNILDVVAGAMYRLSLGSITAPLEKFYIEQHFLYFDPTSLQNAVERAGLEFADLQFQTTDLRRLTLALPVRLALQMAFVVARLTGLQNRLFAIARHAPAMR